MWKSALVQSGPAFHWVFDRSLGIYLKKQNDSIKIKRRKKFLLWVLHERCKNMNEFQEENCREEPCEILKVVDRKAGEGSGKGRFLFKGSRWGQNIYSILFHERKDREYDSNSV